ncbi:SDR family NAD(P)-dependent oxidoreductase [Priestia megaterium]|uniref:SDR family NAD(P)-dependent oxidoreductase n=1 Tax=Priestia megaterium TaxID=1404 RepID=UPI0012D8DB6B|nr:SDR family NAD(P)-dependent oxidoreductase [Priestia megaterium]MUL33971.1 Polyketide synthase PksM [Priestia megaterium]
MSSKITRTDIKENLFKILEQVFRLQQAELEEIETFKELGVGSINAVELLEAINIHFNLNLPTSIIFECVDIDSLTIYIEEQLLRSLDIQTPYPVIIEDKQPDKLANYETEGSDDIAIIGISVRCAGASDQEELWQIISEGKNCVQEVTNPEWLKYIKANSSNDFPIRYGAMDDVECFDPRFFNISIKEAESMDVTQRIMLEECYKGLEDAGYNPSTLRGKQVGTFIGIAGSSALQKDFSHYSMLGYDTSILAARMAYYLDLKGPALAINTACSSSLVAIDIACQKLKNRDIELAIAGGITIYSHPGAFISMNNAGMLSPTGECSPFDNKADGIVVGDGVGVLILKRLSDAIRDRDPIYGIVRGSGTNQDGQTSGITAPSFLAQSQLQESVYRRNQVDVEEIQYIEAHGTATKLGDPIEIHALNNTFNRFTMKKGFCAIGSLKANIGHTTAAAGVLGVIKVLLSMKYKQLPPSINYKKANEHIDFANSSVYVNTTRKEWIPNAKGVRLAAVNSFGYSGTNAHVVIEDYPEHIGGDTVPINEATPGLFLLSTESEKGLRVYAKKILDYIYKNQDLSLTEFLYTFQVARESMSYRLAFLVSSKENLIEQLEQLLLGTSNIVTNHLVGKVSRNGVVNGINITDTEEGQAFISSLIKNHKIKKLAELWVNGYQIEWKDFYQQGSVQRLSGLPTYPFAKECYKTTDFNIKAIENNGTETSILDKAIHPLLHQNTSDLSEQRFSSTFTGKEAFLVDRVIPETALLEMARAAVNQSAGRFKKGKKVIRLHNIEWHSPVVIIDQYSQVHISISTEVNGELKYEIYSDLDEKLYSQGNASLSTITEIPTIDVETLQAQGSKISLPTVQDSFVLHPNLMDIILQVSKGVSVAVQELEIFAPCTSAMWMLIQKDNSGKNNIELCNEQGQICVRFKGLLIQNTNPPKKTETLELMTFEEIWQKQTLSIVSPVEMKTVICFLSNPDYQQVVLASVQAFNPQTKVVFISQDTSYYEVFQNISEQYQEVGAILYLWPIEDERCIRETSNIFSIVKALIATNLKANRFILMGEYKNALDRCYIESWIGFERSLKIVLPNIHFSTILQETGVVSIEESVQRIWNELQTKKAQSAWYQGRNRFVCKVQPTTIQPDKFPLKSGGTYLITGGLGGLGYLFAQHFAEQQPLNLILIGRSSLNEAKQAKISALESLGSQVLYIQSDVTDRNSLQTGILKAKERFGDIHGVLYTAGIVDNKGIHEKGIEEFQQILEPKIKGILELDKVLENEKTLDFICYFSSSSAIIGDFGSCDYSIGNRFQMAYAQYRNEQQRPGKSFVINWPLWKDGGMQFENDENARIYFKTSGQRFLEEEEGLKIFDCILSQNKTQHLILVGQRSRVEHFLGIKQQHLTATAPLSSERGRRPEMKGLKLEKCVEWDLKDQVSRVLKIPRKQLDIEENLADFGFDSISLAEFANLLSKCFEIEVTPSLFFGHSTIKALTEYFVTEYYEKIWDLYQKEVKEEAVFTPSRANSENIPVAKKREKKSHKSRLAMDNSSQSLKEPIAIVGMSGRFPQANNVEDFWKNIKHGKEAITVIPTDRWDWREHNEESHEGKNSYKWGGFVNDIDCFDPLFFKISPKEAKYMDPRQRLFLQEAWHALEDAGYMGNRIRGKSCGVYVGVEEGEYGFLAGEESPLNSNQNATLAARIAYTLDLKGPNMAITAACSSGLVAIHQACQSLHQGDCEMALVGGINLLISPMIHKGMGKVDMLSPDGISYVFDQRANGLVPSEAVAVVVLKPLSQAIRDCDHIYGCIKASGVNYDGQTNGITAPSPVSQSELLQKIYNKYDINPSDIQYVLSHSVGSKLGDSIEVQALSSAFKKYTKQKQFCMLGSIKPLIGHTFAASGIVSLISMIMSMKDQIVPALHNYESSSEYINFKDSPFTVSTKNQAWTRTGNCPRLGAISTTGISGTNAHILIEEYIPPQEELEEDDFGITLSPQIITLSAKNRERLSDLAEQMLDFLEGEEQILLEEVAYTIQVGREAMESRLAMVVRSREELIQGLKEYLKKSPEATTSIYTGNLEEEHLGIHDLLDEKTVLKALLAENNLEKLALYWAKGGEVPWEVLHEGKKISTIHLPTYPFERYRCWIEDKPVIKQSRLSVIKNPLNIKAFGDESLKERIIEIISEVIGIMPAELKLNKPMNQYGFDSILIMELLQQLQTKISPTFNFVKLRECITIQDIIEALVPEAKEQGIVFPSQPKALAVKSEHKAGQNIKKTAQISYSQFPELVLLNDNKQGRPIFWLHGAAGGVGIYSHIARKSKRPFYGIKARGWMTNRTPIRGIYGMAAYYVHIIQTVQPEGPYDLGGYSLGGLLAYEVARQLQELGQKVNSLVMLDTLYSDKIYTKAILPEATFNKKTAILQAVNMTLLTEIQHEPERIPEVLIHRDELDSTVKDEDYIKQILDFSKVRGFKKSETHLLTMIESSSNVQEAFERSGFTALPLPNPEEVTCYFFRNKSGSFLGELEPYFKVKKSPVFDQGNYWKEWELQIPKFHMFDVPSSNHMMLLSEPKAAEQIVAFCAELYREQGMSPDFFSAFKDKHTSIFSNDC